MFIAKYSVKGSGELGVFLALRLHEAVFILSEKVQNK